MVSQQVTPLLRDAYRNPSHSDNGEDIPDMCDLKMISFIHPGYKDSHPILLRVPAQDTVPGQDPNALMSAKRYGIHCATAHTACAIISANRFDGYLSEDKEGLERVSEDLNHVLTKPRYYFHVPYSGKSSGSWYELYEYLF